MPQDGEENKAKWYVAHTYSGYENKVKDTLERAVENRHMQDVIQEIVVPMEERIEIKDGKKKTTLGKVFPGYVLVKMVLTEETWYVVRNVRGVTGFVGAGGKPEPLTDSEIRKMESSNERIIKAKLANEDEQADIDYILSKLEIS